MKRQREGERGEVEDEGKRRRRRERESCILFHFSFHSYFRILPSCCSIFPLELNLMERNWTYFPVPLLRIMWCDFLLFPSLTAASVLSFSFFFFAFPLSLLHLLLPLCIQNTHKNHTHCKPVGRVNETAKNAARERTRVKSLRDAFSRLQSLIPNVPPDTKLSKLDVLILASSHIRHLTDLLSLDEEATSDVSSTIPCEGTTCLTASLCRQNNHFAVHFSALDVSSEFATRKSNSLVALSTPADGCGARGNKYLRPVRVSTIHADQYNDREAEGEKKKRRGEQADEINGAQCILMYLIVTICLSCPRDSLAN